MNEIIYPLIFLVAMVYAAVGHGGASGYLAVLAVFGYAPKDMAASALILNLLVSGTAFVAYWRSGFFTPRLFWPFAFGSMPFAFLGGFVHVSAHIYGGLLIVALLFAASRLFFSAAYIEKDDGFRQPPLKTVLPIGALIGFVSGLVGVGGGIFLSPLLILMGWADAKRTAAVSAAFIWVNSAAGLYGHLIQKGFHGIDLWPLILAAFLGGLVGSHWGAQRFNQQTLRRILASVLVLAAYKSFLLIMQ